MFVPTEQVLRCCSCPGSCWGKEEWEGGAEWGEARSSSILGRVCVSPIGWTDSPYDAGLRLALQHNATHCL